MSKDSEHSNAPAVTLAGACRGIAVCTAQAAWEQASQRVTKRRKHLGTGSLPQDLYPRIFTSGPLLGGQRGLNLLHDCLKHLQVEVHAQLQSTRRNEIGHGGKFSHVERVFVAHVWVAALALHRRGRVSRPRLRGPLALRTATRRRRARPPGLRAPRAPPRPAPRPSQPTTSRTGCRGRGR